jgi:hypothetical protein
MLGGVDRLPAPRRDAVKVAFGLLAAPPPDRFLVALAVLNLLSDAASVQPILCLVDDEQWLDKASVHALAFVARRLDAEAVGIVFAGRRSDPVLDKLPELVIEGLDEGDARLLLESSLVGPLDPLVRDQLLAETHGNPLALLELPRGARLAEIDAALGAHQAAIDRLRPLASSSDDPAYATQLACALTAAGHLREAEPWHARAAARYDELALRHPEAYAGHTADFRRQSGRLQPNLASRV